MKFKLTPRGRKWDMELLQFRDDPIVVDHRWDTAVINCALELYERKGVSRQSYDVWTWDDCAAAEEFITYFTIKYNR